MRRALRVWLLKCLDIDGRCNELEQRCLEYERVAEVAIAQRNIFAARLRKRRG